MRRILSAVGVAALAVGLLAATPANAATVVSQPVVTASVSDGDSWGIDISRWQGNIDVSGADSFVIVKAGGSDVGYAYSDSQYDNNVAKARAAGKAVGHYWFNGYNDGATDADYFVDNLYGYEPGDPLVFDVEGGFESPGKAYAFLSEVRNRLGSDANIYVYMSSSVTCGYDWSSIVALGAKLWVANWGANNGVRSTDPSVCYWGGWTIHQYTSVGTISTYGGSLDGDYALAGAWGNAGTSTVPTATDVPVSTASASTSTSTYTVVSGDYLIAIAAKTGVAWTTIASLNGLSSPYTIYPGQILTLTSSTTTSAVTPSSTYTVVSGDYLSRIGAKLGVSWASIAYANGISSPYIIYPGEVLTIPGTTSSTASSSGTYAVVSGDCLSTIAARLGISWTTLAADNGISSPYTIYPGETLTY